ncbi:hypothetical protein DPMN_005944 [Dreissena polymorpha]|uniref:Uncharacterized protein n=1 Tax=Dreissena polymorpha TaxID=45954 RepID=A0A9D4RWY9_DREPO|nr:hypothetical protein DPMN_005944 [Dreissena polymorpha]
MSDCEHFTRQYVACEAVTISPIDSMSDCDNKMSPIECQTATMVQYVSHQTETIVPVHRLRQWYQFVAGQTVTLVPVRRMSD